MPSGVKLTFEDVKSYIEGKEGNGCKLLSTEYNPKTKLKIQCACGEIFEKTFKVFKSRPQKQCKKCGYKKVSKKLSLDYSEVKAFIEDNGCKLLSTEYTNAREKLLIQCSCGEEFEVRFKDFKDNDQRQCSKCGCKKGIEKRTFPYSEVKAFVEGEEGNGCKLLSETYKNNSTLLLIKCACGEEFEVSFNVFKEQNKRQCNNCGIKLKSGENHPNWNPDITDEEREKGRFMEGYSEWVKAVYKKDNYTCVCCGDNKGGNLNAHHLNSYNHDKEHRIDINNGVTLCKNCHKEFHKIYGYGNNTIAQFREFLYNKYLQNNNLKFLALMETIDLTTRAF